MVIITYAYTLQQCNF